jgi:hypothetical protein
MAYSNEFWHHVGLVHQLGFVPVFQIAEELGLDRKFMREKMRELGHTKTTPGLTIAAVRNGTFIPRDPKTYTPEGMQQTHDYMVEMALCFKSGEFADLDALIKAAHPQSAADFINDRVEARRRG